MTEHMEQDAPNLNYYCIIKRAGLRREKWQYLSLLHVSVIALTNYFFQKLGGLLATYKAHKEDIGLGLDCSHVEKV